MPRVKMPAPRAQRRRVIAVATAALLIIGVGIGPAAAVFAATAEPSPEPTVEPTPVPTPAPVEPTVTMFTDANVARSQENLAPLASNAGMDAVAQAWAVKMATSYGHNPDFATQIPGGALGAAESISKGVTAESVVSSFLSSNSARNVLSSSFTDLGVGYYVAPNGTAYAVMLFAEYAPLVPLETAVKTILTDTNAARAAQGLPALKRNVQLDAVAQAWALNMAASGYRHNPDLFTQIPAGWTNAGENIANGYPSTSVVDAWLASPGHYANIMATNSDIGIGFYVDPKTGTSYAVQDFAMYPVVVPTPTPTPVPSPVITPTPKPTPSATPKPTSTPTPTATPKPTPSAPPAATPTPTPKPTTPPKPVDQKLTDTPPPAIAGSTKVGQTLSVSVGTWLPSVVSMKYQWLRAGIAIPGATAKSYVATAADNGKALSVRVTGSKAGYSSVTKTSASRTISTGSLTKTPTPSISGVPKYRQTLTAETGTWGPSGVTLKYQWARAGVAITGATGKTYQPTTADMGKALTVTVTGSKPGFASIPKKSASRVVTAATFTATPSPRIQGTAKFGYTLTANAGTWSPTGVTLKYQWLRAGVAIKGATAKTYKSTAADVGKALSVVVTGSKPGYTTVAKSSAGTSIKGASLTAAPTPRITGTTKTGQTLTAVTGTWSPSGVTVKYQWLRAGVAIKGATAKTYKLTASDAGKAISVTVTGTKPGYSAVSKTSAKTSAVKGVFSATPVPSISGTAKVGRTLKVLPGTWAPSGVTLKYQWIVGGKAVPGATANTFLVRKSDAGAVITVKVTGTKPSYATVSKTSRGTAKVAR